MLAHQQKQMMVIKGKRTKRPRPSLPLPPLITVSTSSSSLDNTTSARLATASSSTVDLCNSPRTTTTTTTTQDEEDMAYCLILLAQGNNNNNNNNNNSTKLIENSGAHHDLIIYECKTCNRSFQSFQALGGHRASHKKLKAEPDHNQSQEAHQGVLGLSLDQMACKLKVHACGFCGAEFSSGQALGGHMRRHRSLISGGSTPPPRSLQLCLDLNLPAEEEQLEPNNFLFGSNHNALVFTAASLVDCRY